MLGDLKQAIRAAATGPPETLEPGALVRRYRFGQDFFGFQGHFPGHPILPAVLQVLTAMVQIEDGTGQALDLLGVESAKFTMVILPDQEIEVRCRERNMEGVPGWEARLSVGGKRAALIVLTAEPGGSPR